MYLSPVTHGKHRTLTQTDRNTDHIIRSVESSAALPSQDEESFEPYVSWDVYTQFDFPEQQTAYHMSALRILQFHKILGSSILSFRSVK